ncbi:MAG: response regulator transcription factor [Chloroflexi bacterium]|nr:response regulator transcription factor [Chloroflexota bacterium]
MTLRILLADDHELFRAGFRALLEKLGTVRVVAEAGDGREALRLIEEHQPDLVLMDIAMPELNGLEATARIVKKFPHVRVILISMYANEEYVGRAARVGAAGYLLKGASPTELCAALEAIANGDKYFTPAVSKQLVADYMRQGDGVASALERLTPRQREILQLIAEGNTRKEIAAKLGISVKTFDTFRQQLMHELDIGDTAGLVRYAVEMRLVQT